MTERGDDEQPDGFISLPPGFAPGDVDVDSATHRVERRNREEIVFFAAPPGAPVVASDPLPEPVEGPEVAPAPALVEGSAPESSLASTSAASGTAAASDPADEATRMAPSRHATPAWRITVPGHPQITVDVPLYLGRDPSVPADAPNGRAVSIDDPGKSVSKTHALFEVEAGDLWVADLDSTNGVWIVSADGDATDVSPGRPMQVPPGSDVELGDVVIQVEHG